MTGRGGSAAGAGGNAVVPKPPEGDPWLYVGGRGTMTLFRLRLATGTLEPMRAKLPDLVLNLDGRESTFTETANSQVQRKAAAEWDGHKLVVMHSITPALSVTQTLSMEDGKLTIVSAFSAQGFAPVTLTYAKK